MQSTCWKYVLLSQNFQSLIPGYPCLASCAGTRQQHPISQLDVQIIFTRNCMASINHTRTTWSLSCHPASPICFQASRQTIITLYQFPGKPPPCRPYNITSCHASHSYDITSCHASQPYLLFSRRAIMQAVLLIARLPGRQSIGQRRAQEHCSMLGHMAWGQCPSFQSMTLGCHCIHLANRDCRVNILASWQWLVGE